MRKRRSYMRMKYFILFMFSIGLLIYALPLLPFNGQGVAGYFSWIWLLFALFTIAGNLVGLLFSPKQGKNIYVQRKDAERLRYPTQPQSRRIRER
ncbi:hypothetical protein [Fervidibacillus halotolerans]|uniref:Uncharacterized protein n=1 Tax=Fervidibacillus halotolerans TaxID=2980027 RepID=A0A9E8LY26_9BACI|nr:hypothetical protein [Fervidibacillus halotolerans]WAA11676.1 hypothetical protein OE105_08580 [Fervidibacillus halotolerans]